MTRYAMPRRRDYHYYDDDYELPLLRSATSTRQKKQQSTSSTSSNNRKEAHFYDICLPPQGKTYLAIGQDLFSLQEYLTEQQNASLHWYMGRSAYNSLHSKKKRQKTDANDDDTVILEEEGRSSRNNTTASIAESSKGSRTPRKKQHTRSSSSNTNNNNGGYPRMPVPRRDDVVPAAIMVYTDIQTLRGLDTPADYGTGIEYADGMIQLASPPNNNPLRIGLQIGLWLNGTRGCLDVIHGKLDRKINELVYYLAFKCPAEKIFLRIGYGTLLLLCSQTGCVDILNQPPLFLFGFGFLQLTNLLLLNPCRI